MVTLDRKGAAIAFENAEAPAKDVDPKIQVPDSLIVPAEFYSLAEENEKEDSSGEENAAEEMYEKLHLPYELAESCGNFFNCGQSLPPEFKDGLVVRLKLR